MSREADLQPLPPNEFNSIVGDYFEISIPLTRETRLVEDLGFDSLQVFEVILLLEEAANHPVPDEVAERLVTLGDVYDTYEIYLGHH